MIFVGSALTQQYALGVDGDLAFKLANLFSKTNGVLVAAIMSTVGELRLIISFVCLSTQAYTSLPHFST